MGSHHADPTRRRVPAGQRGRTTPATVTPRLAATTTVLSGLGLAVSIYLTISHFTDAAALVCQANATVNCVKVTTSAQSELLGVPVAVLGVGFYAVMFALSCPPAWRTPSPVLRWSRLVLAGIGVLFVAYLVSAELFLIGAICEWCTVVHAVTIALFACLTVAGARWDARPTDPTPEAGEQRVGRRSPAVRRPR